MFWTGYPHGTEQTIDSAGACIHLFLRLHEEKQIETPPMKMEQSVPKRRHIKFRSRGITQNKEYNIQNTAKVGTQE
jgi:hypothetical protein